MDNSNNVQLHEIIKNSLATYLNYKWSHNKLYLKKRKNKSREEIAKKKKSIAVERQHSIINLENDVFIYDAKNRTFTQLDLCECFKNGVKYRKLDPFDTKNKKKKNYELCEKTNRSAEDIQNYQLTQVKDSVEHIFSNELPKTDRWGKPTNGLCPSKFDLFIQKELNKCTGRNFNVKSFKLNRQQESETPSRNKVCSSAAIGYYTITTYDNALQSGSPNNTKDTPAKTGDMKEKLPNQKKMYSKGLQCKKSKHQQWFNKKEQKKTTTTTNKQSEERTKFQPLDPKITDIMSQKKNMPLSRQKQHQQKKVLKKKHSSLSDLFPPTECKNVRNMMQINSSAEIRKMLNDENDSTSSLNLSNTGRYFKTYWRQRPLTTYINTSSTSKDNIRGDTNEERYRRKDPIVVAATSNNFISPICSGVCAKRSRRKVGAPACDCICNTSKYDLHSRGVGPDRTQRSVSGPKFKTGGCSPGCTQTCNTKAAAVGTTAGTSAGTEAGTSAGTPAVLAPPPPTRSDMQSSNLNPADSQLAPKSIICCPCPEPKSKIVAAACICDVLCTLKKRIKQQTEQQNRNLDQILEELNKQDRELREIRQFVEKSKKVKSSFCKSNKPPVCSCYAATVNYDFTTDLTPLPESNRNKETTKGCGDVDGLISTKRVLKSSKSAERTTEPEIIEIFGSDTKYDSKKHKYNLFKKDSWKALWSKNNEVKAFFVNDLFKKRNSMQKNTSTSSNSTTEGTEPKKSKRDYKQWFTNLFNSKKDLRKNAS